MMSLWNTVAELISHVEKGATDSDHFLHLLDKLVFEMGLHQWPTVTESFSQPPRFDSDLIRVQAGASFPDWGYYNEALPVSESIADAEVLVADAIDDVADIIHDLKRAFWIYNSGCESEAEQELKASYETHWRKHLRGLQHYVAHLEG